MGKMGIKIMGPFRLSMAAPASGQDFMLQGLAVAPQSVQRIVHPIVMTIFAGRQIFGKPLGIVCRAPAMHTGVILVDHVRVGEFLIGGGLFNMAFGGAINLGDVGVGDFIKANMTVFAFQFSMNRSGKLLIVDIEHPFGTGFVEPSHPGKPVAQQTVFRVGHGVGCK
jgi:hypothetical protein